jgi:hypothetical protein
MEFSFFKWMASNSMHNLRWPEVHPGIGKRLLELLLHRCFLGACRT